MVLRTRVQRIRVAILLGMVLSLTGCEVSKQLAKGNFDALRSPQPRGNQAAVPPTEGNTEEIHQLHALDASLTLIDIGMVLLRINHLMLQRIQISAEAEWPDRLELSTSEQQYLAWLDEQGKKDFSFLAKETDFPLLMLRPQLLMAELRLVGRKVEHQRRAIDAVPPECHEISLVSTSQQRPKSCSHIIDRRNKSCPFFTESLEAQLFSFVMGQDSSAWVETPVKDSCLVQAIATQSQLYTGFDKAFHSVLPRHLVREITNVERNLRQLAQQRGELTGRLREKQDKKRLANQAQIIELDHEMAALKSELKTLRTQVESAQAAQDKLYKEAMAAVEGTPETVRLAEQLYKVGTTVRANLALVISDNLLALENMAQVARKWADDPKAYFATTLSEADYDEQWLDRLVQRVSTLAPNIVMLNVQLYNQRRAIGKQLKYLDKLMKIKILDVKAR